MTLPNFDDNVRKAFDGKFDLPEELQWDNMDFEPKKKRSRIPFYLIFLGIGFLTFLGFYWYPTDGIHTWDAQALSNTSAKQEIAADAQQEKKMSSLSAVKTAHNRIDDMAESKPRQAENLALNQASISSESTRQSNDFRNSKQVFKANSDQFSTFEKEELLRYNPVHKTISKEDSYSNSSKNGLNADKSIIPFQDESDVNINNLIAQNKLNRIPLFPLEFTKNNLSAILELNIIDPLKVKKNYSFYLGGGATFFENNYNNLTSEPWDLSAKEDITPGYSVYLGIEKKIKDSPFYVNTGLSFNHFKYLFSDLQLVDSYIEKRGLEYFEIEKTRVVVNNNIINVIHWDLGISYQLKIYRRINASFGVGLHPGLLVHASGFSSNEHQEIIDLVQAEFIKNRTLTMAYSANLSLRYQLTKETIMALNTSIQYQSRNISGNNRPIENTYMANQSGIMLIRSF